MNDVVNTTHSDLMNKLLIAALMVLALTHEAFGDCAFDENRAFAHLRALVEIGPRPSDSPEIVRAQEYIIDELTRQGVEVKEQDFVADTPLGPKQMKNIIGVVPGRSDTVLIIGTHYETKLIDGIRFVGANDGTSGTAVLLELARCLKDRDNRLTIWLVFFDGEEAFVKWSRKDSLYGSRHMVKLLMDSGEIKNVGAMLLLDMIGDAHLSVEWETNSTAWLKEIVWAKAQGLGYEGQFRSNHAGIEDDHIPFLEQGIPALDIIDFHYGPYSRTNEYWHTEQDNLEHVSSDSLKVVGDVVLESLPEIAARVLPD